MLHQSTILEPTPLSHPRLPHLYAVHLAVELKHDGQQLGGLAVVEGAEEVGVGALV
jgi:hypothetical protein